MNFLSKYLFVALLFVTACDNSPIESIEVRDEAGKIKEKYERRRSDFAKEGIYQRFSPDGKLVEQATFRNDVIEGDHQFFYKNGQVEIIEPNVGGKVHGKYRKYNENGTLILEQDYQNGVLEGISKVWYANGTLKEEVTMRQNEENGPFREWHENGNLKAEGTYKTPDDPDFVGEKEDGELRLYDENGNLERVMDCAQGVCRTRKEEFKNKEK